MRHPPQYYSCAPFLSCVLVYSRLSNTHTSAASTASCQHWTLVSVRINAAITPLLPLENLWNVSRSAHQTIAPPTIGIFVILNNHPKSFQLRLGSMNDEIARAAPCVRSTFSPDSACSLLPTSRQYQHQPSPISATHHLRTSYAYPSRVYPVEAHPR